MPVVLVDGQVIGLWSATEAAAKVEPFELLGRTTKAAVADALADVVTLLDGSQSESATRSASKAGRGRS